MNIIIVGCGKVGRQIAKSLNAEKKHNITVIDIKQEFVSKLEDAYDLMGVVGNGADMQKLKEAGVENADLLIAATGSDEVNLLTCLVAKKASGCSTVARISKPEYREGIGLIKNDLGLEMLINPDREAAREIARLLRVPTAVDVDTFVKGNVEILKFNVKEGSPLVDMVVWQVRKKIGVDVLICGIERNETAYIPSGDFQIKLGDSVSFVASPKNAELFFKKIGVKNKGIKDTIIVGGGPIAYYLARELAEINIDVKIIEKSGERCDRLFEMLPKAVIINADGTEYDDLMEAGLANAQSFIALTNVDEENIVISVMARENMSGKIITKINRHEYIDLAQKLDLDTIISSKNVTAENVLKFVRAKGKSLERDIQTIHEVLEGKAEALEFYVERYEPYVGVKLKNLSLVENVVIACIYRNGKPIMPGGEDAIAVGDSVIAVTTHTGVEDLKDLIK